MDHIAALISAIAGLLWPVLGFVVLKLYHSEICDLIRRLRRGKFLGQEIELRESLAELNVSAQEAVQAVAPPLHTQLPSGQAAGVTDQASSQASEAATDAALDRVLDEAARSPKAAMVLLASDIERSLRRLLANLGLVPPGRFVASKQAFELLSAREVVPKSLLRAVDAFTRARNRIVHGFNASDDEVLSAIDSGILILRALEAVPHATHTVSHPSTELFLDSDGKRPFTDAVGLLLDNEGKPGRGKITQTVFPTTRRDYRSGQMVAWQWNMTRVFPECWYRHPATGQINYAWTSSAEFVGSPIE